MYPQSLSLCHRIHGSHAVAAPAGEHVNTRVLNSPATGLASRPPSFVFPAHPRHPDSSYHKVRDQEPSGTCTVTPKLTFMKIGLNVKKTQGTVDRDVHKDLFMMVEKKIS